MPNLGVADLKARLSQHLNRVKAGEEIVITEHWRPIARLVPLAGAVAQDARVQDLVRRGVLRPPQEPLDLKVILDPRRPQGPRARSAARVARGAGGRPLRFWDSSGLISLGVP